MSRKNVREVALDALLKIEKNQAYSNLLVNDALKKSELNDKDAALFTEIVYRTVQRKKTLDYFLSPFLPKKIKKKDEWIIPLLWMSIYQMVYLDRVPDRAIIFEAVQLAKKRGHRGLANMVNGILRNIQRSGLPGFEKIDNDMEQLAVKYSHPIWLVEEWVNQYGLETTKSICEANLKTPPITARVNTSKSTVQEVIDMLKKEGVIAKPGKLSSDAIEIEEGNLIKTKVFEEGYATIQDESSMLVARALAPQENDRILDCCAAPGGKTTHISELLNGTGEVIAFDLHRHKVKLIQEQAARLKLNNIHAQALDAREAEEHFPKESFDRILVDAPCSGFGVIRRKPDIKWSKSEKDVQEITKIQLDILDSIAPLLKKGGTLIYSTCTIEKRENEQVIEAFLNKHHDFEASETLKNNLPNQIRSYLKDGEASIQILPHYYESDGFFIASLRKKSS